jgi:hypothetical protein
MQRRFGDEDGPVAHLKREYRHLDCDQVTVVSGDHLVMLECPFRHYHGTFCVSCNDMVPMDSVMWEDSGESIQDYRNQVYYSVSWMRRLYLTWVGTTYEGALNLRLDKWGQPLPTDDPADTDFS